MGVSYAMTLIGGGLNLFTMMLPNVIYFTFGSLLEIPTGIFGDRVSLKTSVRLGFFFWSLGTITYGIVPMTQISPIIGFVIAESLAALGNAFISGAFLALLMRTTNGNEQTVRDTEAKAKAYGGYVGLIAAATTGFIVANLGVSFSWFLSGGISLLALIALQLFMPDAMPFRQDSLNPLAGSIETFKSAFRFFQNNKRSTLLMLANSILEFSFQPINMYWSLLFNSRFGAEFTGLLWSGANLFLSKGSSDARKAKPGISILNRSLLLVSACILLGLILDLIGFALGLAAMFVAHEYFRGKIRPVYNANLTKGIEEGYTATAISLAEAIVSMSRVAGLLFFGFVAVSTNIETAWLTASVTMLLAVYLFKRAERS
jgi:MFS family permease